MKYPSLLRRYMATMIDLLVILLIFYLYAQSPLYDSDSGVAATWPLWLYVAYEPLCNRYATTVGQLLMHFRVRTIDGNRRVPLWRGLVRVVSKYLLGVISFIRMPVQKQRRALHDIIAGTLVMEVRDVEANHKPAA